MENNAQSVVGDNWETRGRQVETIVDSRRPEHPSIQSVRGDKCSG